jgi:regulator of protease activity HflC (stomatin/prohibitin superfamily)
MDPQKASYGINNYMFATVQLAQTTMRSVIGKLDLDQTFEERENINAQIVEAADKACDPWGIKITRYEIKDIKPPQSIKDAMEKQMRAEREKRAVIAQSEGEKQAQINRAEGEKQELIALSEGQRQKCINEATGHAVEIEKIAEATSESILMIAKALQTTGGHEAIQLKVAEKYLEQLGKFAQNTNTLILPSNLSDLSSISTMLIGGIAKTIVFPLIFLPDVVITLSIILSFLCKRSTFVFNIKSTFFDIKYLRHFLNNTVSFGYFG